MGARPIVSIATEELYEGLEPAFTDGDEDRAWAALNLCAALVGAGIDQVHLYVTEKEDGTPGWGIALDPENVPLEALPWLAQFDGAVLTPQMSEAEQRQAIAQPEAMRRGTLAAITQVAKRRLTGSQTLLIDERYQGFGYRLRIRTLASETPDPEATEEEIRREQKPIGIVLTYLAITTWDWGDLQLAEASWAAVQADFSDWLEARTQLP